MGYKAKTGIGTTYILGLPELNRALKKIDPEVKKEFTAAMRSIARKVMRRVRNEMPKKSGNARRSVRSGVSARGAWVQHGNETKAPYAPWLDFGGRLQKEGMRRNEQLRPQIQKGRYLYPTIEAMQPETYAAAMEAIKTAKKRAGLE